MTEVARGNSTFFFRLHHFFFFEQLTIGRRRSVFFYPSVASMMPCGVRLKTFGTIRYPIAFLVDRSSSVTSWPVCTPSSSPWFSHCPERVATNFGSDWNCQTYRLCSFRRFPIGLPVSPMYNIAQLEQAIVPGTE